MPLRGGPAAGPTRRVLGLALALALVGCQGNCPPRARPLGRPPRLGHRVLVLAPHPDDEVLGASGLLAGTLRRGGRARVIVATDGAADGRGERAVRLAATRESETRRALGRLGLGAGDVTFLGYADDGLATAWSERWQVARRDVGDVSASRLVEGLHAALRAFEPDTVVLPMPLDRHPDHAALGRLAMLAMLEEPGEPDLLAYLVHGGPGWPAHRGSAGCGTIPRPGGCSASLAWADLRLDPPTIALKASLIEEYRSQLGRGAVLRPFAAENEPFTGGVLVHANRAMSRWRPGVHRASGGVSIDVPRSACGADVAGGGRLRLRYVEAGEIQERLVVLGAVPQVLGGAPGVALGAADDVRVALAPRAVRMRLNGRTVADVRGVVLDAISPGGLRAAAPAWLLRW